MIGPVIKNFFRIGDVKPPAADADGSQVTQGMEGEVDGGGGEAKQAGQSLLLEAELALFQAGI